MVSVNPKDLDKYFEAVDTLKQRHTEALNSIKELEDKVKSLEKQLKAKDSLLIDAYKTIKSAEERLMPDSSKYYQAKIKQNLIDLKA